MIASVLLLAAVCTYSLGVVAVARGQQVDRSRSFFVFCMLVGAWLTCYGLTYLLAPAFTGVLTRCIVAPAIFIPPVLLYFLRTFERQKQYLSPIEICVFGLGGLAVLASVPTSWHMRHIRFESGAILFEPGLMYHLQGLLLLAGLVLAGRTLWMAYQKALPEQKIQISLVCAGIGVSALAGLIFNFVLPALGFEQWNRFGPLAVFALVLTSYYAMLRHRFLDVKHLIQRSMVYALLYVSLVGLMWFGILGVGTYAQRRFGLPLITVLIFVSFVTVALYEPLKRIFHKLTHSLFLIGEQTEPEWVSRWMLATSMGSDQNNLLKEVLDILVNDYGISRVGVYLSEDNAGRFSMAQSVGVWQPETEAVESLGWVQAIKQDPRIVLGELEQLEGHVLPEALTQFMLTHGVEALVPLRFQDAWQGLLLLGEKRSQQRFTREDGHLLKTLATPLSAALANAKLYSSVFNLKTYFESVLDRLPVGVLTFRESGQVSYINKKGVAFLGVMPGADIQRKPWGEVAELLPFAFLLEEAFRGGQMYDFIEVEHHGVAFGVSVARTMTPLESDGQQGVLLVLADLTSLHELQSQLARHERLAALGVMAAGIAHEIRNPMVSIKTFSQLVPVKFEDPSFREKFVQVVLPQLNRIEDLVTALLHAGRPRKPSRDLVDANEIIKDVLLLCEAERRDHNCSFSFEPSRPVLIYADRSQMTQVFLNLVRNAIQAIASKGLLQVTAREIDERWAEIEFKDTGIGMTEEQLEHLFDPFYTTKDEGTGLGLSISYRIIEEHGGRIILDSTPKVGTSFTLRMPRRADVSTKTHLKIFTRSAKSRVHVS